jgi:hypothetical protein
MFSTHERKGCMHAVRKDIRKQQANRDTICQKGKARQEGLHAGVAALTSDASDQTAAVQPIFAQKSDDQRLARPLNNSGITILQKSFQNAIWCRP